MKYIPIEHVPSRAYKELRELSDSFRFTTELSTDAYLYNCVRWPKANQPFRTVLVESNTRMTDDGKMEKDRHLIVYALLNGMHRLDLCKLYLTCDGQELSREETEDIIVRAARFSDMLSYYFRDQYVREPRYCFSEEQAKKDLQDHPQIEALLATLRKDFQSCTHLKYWSKVPRERKQRAPETYYRKRGEAKVTLVNINAAQVELRNTVLELGDKIERVEKCLLALAQKTERLEQRVIDAT